jgi:hypothetical protein
MIKKGSLVARKLTRAHILLQTDGDASDTAIATAYVGERTWSARARSLSWATWTMPSANAPAPAPSANWMRAIDWVVDGRFHHGAIESQLSSGVTCFQRQID